MKKYQHKAYQYQKVTHKCQRPVEYIDQNGGYQAAGKHCRKEMDQFQFSRKVFINIDPSPAKKMQLFVKLHKTGPAFMIYFCIRDQSDLKTGLMDPNAILNVLTQPGQDKPTDLFPYLAGQAHIETTRMKLSDVFFVPPDPSCRKG